MKKKIQEVYICLFFVVMSCSSDTAKQSTESGTENKRIFSMTELSFKTHFQSMPIR